MDIKTTVTVTTKDIIEAIEARTGLKLEIGAINIKETGDPDRGTYVLNLESIVLKVKE